MDVKPGNLERIRKRVFLYHDDKHGAENSTLIIKKRKATADNEREEQYLRELKMWFGVLELTIKDYVNYVKYKASKNKLLIRGCTLKDLKTLPDWFNSDEDVRGSFLWICDTLSRDPDAVRVFVNNEIVKELGTFEHCLCDVSSDTTAALTMKHFPERCTFCEYFCD
jgi:hypothetical protein